jgi:hypothetical protein
LVAGLQFSDFCAGDGGGAAGIAGVAQHDGCRGLFHQQAGLGLARSPLDGQGLIAFADLFRGLQDRFDEVGGGGGLVPAGQVGTERLFPLPGGMTLGAAEIGLMEQHGPPAGVSLGLD